MPAHAVAFTLTIIDSNSCSMAGPIDKRQSMRNAWPMTALGPNPTPAADSLCGAPLTSAPLPVEEARRLAAMFKTLADPARLRLLSLIAGHQGAEACVCDLTGPVDLSQPTVSHHLKLLTDAGLLTREQRGKWAYYAVVPQALDALGDVLRIRHHGHDRATCC